MSLGHERGPPGESSAGGGRRKTNLDELAKPLDLPPRIRHLVLYLLELFPEALYCVPRILESREALLYEVDLFLCALREGLL